MGNKMSHHNTHADLSHPSALKIHITNRRNCNEMTELVLNIKLGTFTKTTNENTVA
jgi:hypothetical protein